MFTNVPPCFHVCISVQMLENGHTYLTTVSMCASDTVCVCGPTERL